VSYLVFLILFVYIPLTGMFYVMRRSIRRIHVTILSALTVIAVIYTTPWDNYLVATGILHYEPNLVLGFNLGYVPIERYAFFVLQTLLTGVFAFWLWRRFYGESFTKNSGREE
jgi:lycopene beta-cyclase